MDPFQGLADFVLGKLKQSAIALWSKFLFELAFSAIASFLFVCGGALLAGKSIAFSIGLGMVWAAMALVYLFRKESSRLTRGMLVILPGDEAGRELASDFQSIQKPDKEK